MRTFFALILTLGISLAGVEACFSAENEDEKIGSTGEGVPGNYQYQVEFMPLPGMGRAPISIPPQATVSSFVTPAPIIPKVPPGTVKPLPPAQVTPPTDITPTVTEPIRVPLPPEVVKPPLEKMVVPEPIAVPVPKPKEEEVPPLEEVVEEKPIVTPEPALTDLEIERRDEFYPILVTPTRLEERRDRLGRSVALVRRKDMDAQGSFTLSEALRNIPGVRVRTLGTLGDQTTLQIRGNRSYDTALLINGMPLRDASGTQGSAVNLFSEISTDHFEEIEVLRGAGSTLYGSEAIGGVVHLRMKEGKAGPPRSTVILDIGEDGSYHQTYQASGMENQLDYFLGYTRVGTDGVLTSDTYESGGFSANVGFKPGDNLEFRFIMNTVISELDINDGAGLNNGILVENKTDPNHLRQQHFLHFNSMIRHQPWENFQHTVRWGVLETDRRFINGADAVDSRFSDSQFDGDISNLEYQADLYVNDHLSIVAGAESENEEFRQLVSNVEDVVSVERLGAYVEGRLSFLDNTLNLALGGRTNEHERYGSHETSEVSVSYLFRPTQTRFKGHWGTGFRDPSLFELFGRTHSSSGSTFEFGNLELEPEESRSWDAGVEQELFDGSVLVIANIFRTEFDKRIVFGQGSYENVEGDFSRGGELESIWIPNENLRISTAYTRTIAESNGQVAPSLPHNLFGMNVDWEFLEKFKYHFDLTYRGVETVQLFATPSFTSEFVRQNSYVKADTKLGFAVTENAEAWFVVENIFNEKIVEEGFRNPGRMVRGGVTIKI